MGVRNTNNIKLMNRRSEVATTGAISPSQKRIPSKREIVDKQISQNSKVLCERIEWRMNQDKFKEVVSDAFRDRFFSPKVWDDGNVIITIPPGSRIGKTWGTKDFDFTMHQKNKKKETIIKAHVTFNKYYEVNRGYVHEFEFSDFRAETLQIPKKAPDPWKALDPGDKERMDNLIQEFIDNPKAEIPLDTYYKPRSANYWNIRSLVMNFFLEKVFTCRNTSRSLLGVGGDPWYLPTSTAPHLNNLDNSDPAVQYSRFKIYRKYKKTRTHMLATIKGVYDPINNTYDLFLIGLERTK